MQLREKSKEKKSQSRYISLCVGAPYPTNYKEVGVFVKVATIIMMTLLIVVREGGLVFSGGPNFGYLTGS